MIALLTHFTDKEKSPGELSLSRTKNAPSYFSFFSVSSALALDSLPKYQLHKKRNMSKQKKNCEYSITKKIPTSMYHPTTHHDPVFLSGGICPLFLAFPPPFQNDNKSNFILYNIFVKMSIRYVAKLNRRDK